MREQVINFNTALLAKQKGFNEKTFTFYQYPKKSNKYIKVYGRNKKIEKDYILVLPDTEEFGKNNWSYVNYNEKELIKIVYSDCTIISNFVSAPTQSLLQKWLREKHNIVVTINFTVIDDSEKAFVWIINQYVEEGIENTRKKDIQDFWKEYQSFSEKRMSWFETYEEALEKGLFEALNLINNENSK